MARILVTGATGFIGQHLVERLLQDGFTVRAMSRGEVDGHRWGQQVEVVKGDVRDARSARLAVDGVEGVFHLAGKVHDVEEIGDVAEHESVTLQGTQNLLAAARESDIKRFIFLSSLSVYGAGSDAVRDETADCCAVSVYGRAKFQAEQCVFDHGKQFNIHVSCLRPAMVYGPGCKGNLPRMIKMIDRGLFPPLRDVKNRRSMVHVTDVVEASVLAAFYPMASGQCYIVTDGRAYSTREIYEMICRALGKRIPGWSMPPPVLKSLARLGDVLGSVKGRRVPFDSDALEKLTGSALYSVAKISRELGYRPSVTLEDALPEMIARYRQAAS